MTTTQDFTTQDATNLGADKIARSSTAFALYNNGIWAGDKGLATVDQTNTYNSGSGTWNKPAGFDDRDTVLIEMWGGGGSGGASAPFATYAASGGGGGGAYLAYAIRYVDCPATIAYSVGAGGAAKQVFSATSVNGDNGGDSTVTISGVTFTAGGGGGGVASAYAAPLTVAGGSGAGQTVKNCAFSLVPWGGGAGGAVTTGTTLSNGSNSVHGAGGGGAASINANLAYNSTGGTSFHGGAGGNAVYNDNGVNGSAPGGGGGGAARTTTPSNSGAGGAGRIVISVLRGWHPTQLSR